MSASTDRTRQAGARSGVSRIVAEREVRARFKEKAFIWGFLVMLLVSWGGLVALDYFGDRDTTYDLGVVGAPRDLADSVEEALGEGYTVDATAYDDRPAAEAAVTDGDLDAALVADRVTWTHVAGSSIDATWRTPWARPWLPLP